MSVYIDKKKFRFFSNKDRTNIILKLNKKKYLDFEGSFHKFPVLGGYLNRSEDQITFYLGLLFFSFAVTLGGLKRCIIKNDEEWRYSLAFHNGAIWWNLGGPPHSWSTKDKWRNSNFDFLNFMFGMLKHAKSNREEHTHKIKLPEGEYQADMIFEDCIRWRSRIPRFIWKRVIRRVDLKITPEIPYPGKNDPVDGCSHCSFPAKNVEEVMDHIYQDIKKKRRGNFFYYSNKYKKVVDDFTYNIHGLPINIGRVPVEKRNKEWQPIGYTEYRCAEETFRKLRYKKEPFTKEEIGFINKHMGKSNSIDFIKEPSQEELQKEMLSFLKKRAGCSEMSAGENYGYS